MKLADLIIRETYSTLLNFNLLSITLNEFSISHLIFILNIQITGVEMDDLFNCLLIGLFVALFVLRGQLFEAQTFDRFHLMCDERGPLALSDELLLELM